MKLEDVARLLRPIRTQVANMVARSMVSKVDDSTKLQALELEILAGEVRAGLERIQSYGFTSVPLDPVRDADGNITDGPEAVVVFPTGRRDHGLVIAVDDRRYRLKPLQKGEVAIYTDEGDKVVIKRGGTIELTAKTRVHLVTPLVESSSDFKINGKLHVVQDVTLDAKLTAAGVIETDSSDAGAFTARGGAQIGGAVVATGEVTGSGKNLSTHTHGAGALTDSGVSGGTVSGTTGAPS